MRTRPKQGRTLTRSAVILTIAWIPRGCYQRGLSEGWPGWSRLLSRSLVQRAWANPSLVLSFLGFVHDIYEENMHDDNAIPVETNAEPTAFEDIAETFHPPGRRDLSFYIVLILAVIPLWSIAPLSWFFVIYSLHTGIIWSFTWRGWVSFVAALAEVRSTAHAY